jgi:hypothetical protein
MVSAASMHMNDNMETTSPEEEYREPCKVVVQQPQDMVTAAPAADDVPDHIVVVSTCPSTTTTTNKKHRRSRNGKSKDKVATKRTSSGSGTRKHRKEKKHAEADEVVGDNNDLSNKERRRSKRRHRKESSSRRNKKDMDPNDPETIAKGRELLLAAMGVKKQPDIEPCFVNTNVTLDNNPIYQSNKQRLVVPNFAIVASEASFAMVMDASDNSNDMMMRSRTSLLGEEPRQESQSSVVDNEYDQFVDF